MAYEFKGYDWCELAECWGIKVTPEPMTAKVQGTDEVMHLGDRPEKIDKIFYVNGTRITFELTDEEEVLAEKIKQHIQNTLNTSGDFMSRTMRPDLVKFLNKLADEEEQSGFNAPVFRAIATLESDFTLAQWVINNLEKLWS